MLSKSYDVNTFNNAADTKSTKFTGYVGVIVEKDNSVLALES